MGPASCLRPDCLETGPGALLYMLRVLSQPLLSPARALADPPRRDSFTLRRLYELPRLQHVP